MIDMRTKRRSRWTLAWPLALMGMLLVAGCSPEEDPFGPVTGFDPTGLAAEYTWVLQRWDGASALGYPAVELSWELPARWNGEAFRVYARRAGGGYQLVATVTSCAAGTCLYRDTNVSAGQSYDYYIASVDPRDSRELGTSRAIRVDVPARSAVATPAAPLVTPLDGAVYLSWTLLSGIQRYMVLGQAEGETMFLIGETDGSGFYDDRAQNGRRYSYRIAAVDATGHVSALGPAAQAIPRPDFHADVVYAHADLPASSGFRFVASEADDPILPGADARAQWRLEVVNGVYGIQPLGNTRITGGTFTTQLTCGPGSDADCVDIRIAPPDAHFGAAAVPTQAGHTYVLRVIGADGRPHFGKLRVQGNSVGAQGRLIVFDWAYQLLPDERSLHLRPR
jgi:hypothetical protein